MGFDVEGKVTHERDTTDAALKADPSQRLIAPREGRARVQSAMILAACLAAHALLLAILLFEDFSVASEPTRSEEIPVEIVAELPPEQQAEPFAKPLPPPPDLITPPVVKAKPPPDKTQLDDVEVAHDAPVSGNADQTHKGELDQETKAPRVAPPPKLAAPQPTQEKPEQEKAATASNEKSANPSAPTEPQKVADDTPDAEALDKAQPELPAKPQKKPAPRNSKSPTAQGQKETVAQQLAALSQAPNYSLGAAAKSAPIGGGTEKASYESLLNGLIRRQYQPPPPPRGHPVVSEGLIAIYVDELGNLTHQVIYRASGNPAVDNAWLSAVRRAAPFPPPPRGVAHNLGLFYPSDGS